MAKLRPRVLKLPNSPNAPREEPARGSHAAYLERTSRNLFWVGGELGQQRILDARVAVAGLGGIGGMIAETLVRVGVGGLRIADLDRVDLSNINRQAMARKSTLGKNKADAMADLLREIADDFELTVYREGVHEGMVREFVEGATAVVDEIDIFAPDRKKILHQEARRLGLPVYTAYAVGTGVHFYKFLGDAYTVEDFLKDVRASGKPSGDELIRTIVTPVPPYLEGKRLDEFRELIDRGTAPIFGPSTLFGHGLVCTRLLMDLLNLGGQPGFVPTPVMPEYLVLDAGTLTFRVHKVPGR